MVQPLEANYGAGATKNVPIPQTADQLEDWLSRHCDAGSQSTNLTTFRGKKKDPEGNVIREGSWYLFDQYRDSFAEHFIRIYHEPGAYLPCLNMLIPAGDGWRCKPYLDIDFPNIVVFRRLLEHLNKLPDDFYREVRHCFAKFVLDKDEEDHDSNIAFSMQPSNPHKFHLIYIGEKNLSWSKTEMKDILKKIGRFLTVYFALEDLHRVQPIMVPAIPPSAQNTKGVPAKHWISNYSNDSTLPFGMFCAAFIDTNVKGLRPLGCSKLPGKRDKDFVYHIFHLNATPINKIKLTKATFLGSLILPVGQEALRVQKADQMIIGEGEIMGIENFENVENVEIVPKVQQWLIGQQLDTSIQNGQKRRAESVTSLVSSPSSKMRRVAGPANNTHLSEFANIAAGSHSVQELEDLKYHQEMMRRFTQKPRPTLSIADNQSVVQSSNASSFQAPRRRDQLQEPEAQQLSKKKRSKPRTDDIPDIIEEPEMAYFAEMAAKAKREGPNKFAVHDGDRYMKHMANLNEKEGNKTLMQSPLRPSNITLRRYNAAHLLKTFVTSNPKLRWGQDLLDRKWTFARLVKKAFPENMDSILLSFGELGISDQAITHALAVKLNAALVHQSGEYYAEVLQYLVGTNGRKQGRIEVDGKSGNNLQWWIFNVKNHGWRAQASCNTHVLAVLRGIFVAYRQYLIQNGRAIEKEFPESRAAEWFNTSSHDEWSSIMLCYDETIRNIIGGSGSQTCNRATLSAWECMIRNRSIVRHGGIVNALNEDRYKIAFTNGVYDLQRYDFRDGKPEDFISYNFGYEYYDYETQVNDQPEHQPFILGWKKFLSTIFPSREIRPWMCRVLAACLGGEPPDLLFILTGAGSNGKSVFIRLLESLFGPEDGYYATISSSKLTEKKGHSTSADPQTGQLKGKRVRADTEPQEGEALNAAYIKERFDTVTCRGLYEGSARNQHHFYKHFLACNTTPPSSGDEANTRRQIHIPMPVRFTMRPNRDDPLDMPADELTSKKCQQWKYSLMSYLISLWRKHDAGNPDKPDPLRIHDLPPVIVHTNDKMRQNSDLALRFIAELKKSNFGFMSFTKIWEAYLLRYDVENTRKADQRHNTRISKEQMYRHLDRKFGQPQILSEGPEKGDYYRCWDPQTMTEPTEYDPRAANVQNSLGEQMGQDLARVQRGHYDLPSTAGYRDVVAAPAALVYRRTDLSFDANQGMEDDSDDDSSELCSLTSIDDIGSDSGSGEDSSDSEEDGNFNIGGNGQGARSASSPSRDEDRQSSVIGDFSVEEGQTQDGQSHISEISIVNDKPQSNMKRKRLVPRRLQEDQMSSIAANSEEEDDLSQHDVPQPREATSYKKLRIVESDSDEGESAKPIDEPTTEPTTTAMASIASNIVAQPPAGAVTTTGPSRKKRSRNHKSGNRFIDEGAHVSDDDGEGDEAEADLEDETDRQFIDDDINEDPTDGFP